MNQNTTTTFFITFIIFAIVVVGGYSYYSSRPYVPQRQANDTEESYAIKFERLESARKNIKKSPSGFYYNELGVAWYEFGEDARGALAYKKAIALDPEHWVSYLNLGNVYVRMQQLSDAERAFQDGIAIRPKQTLLHKALLELYKNWDERSHLVEDVLKNALEGTDNDPNFLDLYIAFLEERGRASEVPSYKKLRDQKRGEALEKLEQQAAGAVEVE